MNNTTVIVIGDNPTRNRQIQELLLKYGFKWLGDCSPRYLNAKALSISTESHFMTYLSGYWDYMNQVSVIDEKAVTEDWVKSLPNAVQPAPPIPVRELTMEELNDLSVKNFGYKIKIKK